MKSRGETRKGWKEPRAGVGAAGEGSHTKSRPVFTPAGRPGADRANDTTDRGSSWQRVASCFK